MYEGTSFIHPRIAGSTEMWEICTTNSPWPGVGTGSSVRSQTEASGVPEGRAARRICWLVSLMARFSHEAAAQRAHELLRGLLGLLGDVELPADAVPRQFGRSAAPPESLPAITLAARLPTAPPI